MGMPIQWVADAAVRRSKSPRRPERHPEELGGCRPRMPRFDSRLPADSRPAARRSGPRGSAQPNGHRALPTRSEPWRRSTGSVLREKHGPPADPRWSDLRRSWWPDQGTGFRAMKRCRCAPFIAQFAVVARSVVPIGAPPERKRLFPRRRNGPPAPLRAHVEASGRAAPRGSSTPRSATANAMLRRSPVSV